MKHRYQFLLNFNSLAVQKTKWRANLLLLPLLLVLLSTISYGQIAQRGSAISNSAATTNMSTIQVNKPTGVVSGDIMIVSILQNETDNDNGGLNSANLTGWTLIDGRLIESQGTANGDNAWYGTVLYRVADGTEGASFTFTLPNSRADMALISIVAFSGATATNGVKADGTAGGPFDVDPGTLRVADANTSTANAITTVSSNTAILMLSLVSNDRSFSNWVATDPSSLTELYDNLTTSADDGSVGAAWNIKTSAGSTGNGTATLSGGDFSGAILIALKPCVIVNAGSALSAICQGGTSAGLGGSTGGSATGGTWSDGAVGGSFSPNATTLNATYTPPSTYTGTVTLTLTTSGGSCGTATATKTLTVSAPNSATISYAGTPFCKSLTAGQAVTRTGTTGGTYSSTTGLTISSSTGAITPSTSTAGTYTVTYTMAAGACSAATTTTSVTITALPTATISYAGAPFCITDGTIKSVNLTGTTGGTFSSTAGLVIDASSGEIRPSSSTAGTYTVTYTMAAANGCAAQTATTSVTINAEASATISYASAQFCRSVATSQAVTRTGTAGGAYTATPTGLTINASTGAITPSTSTAGTYTITYTVTPGGCSTFTTTTSVTINALPTAVTVTGGGTVCDQTILTANGGIGGTIYYQGTTNNGTSTATESSSQTISTSGTYYFNAVTSEGCWGTQGSATVTVNVSPTTTGVTVCAGGSGELTATSVCNTLTGQTSGPRDATSGTNVTGVGTLAWGTPGSIAGAGTAGMSIATSTTSNYLQGSAYGFAIPTNATINGITLNIRKSSSGSNAPFIRDSEVKLVKGGTILATNKATTTTEWSNNSTLATTTYGGATDLWNTTWTPAEINASNFGAVLAATNASTNNSRTAAVDWMQITVTYTVPGSFNWYTASSGGTLLGSGTTFNPVGVAGSGLANTNTVGTTTFYAECSTGSTCRGAANFTINNDNNPKGKLSISDTTLCSPNAIDISVADTGLYASGYPAGTTVEWLGYGISGPVATTTISSNSGSTFQAKITLGGTGCVGLSNTVTVTTRSIALLPHITPASCGQNNGIIKVTAVSPVSPPYRFIWKDNSNSIIRDFITNDISDSIMNLASGNYMLEVYDNNGGTISCQSTTFTYTVGTSPTPSLNITGTNNSCNGTNDGTATVSVTGAAPFTYLWNAGTSNTTNSIFGLSSGTYIVTVTDIYGCSSQGAVTITTPSPVSGNGVINSSCSNINNGSIVLSLNGGTGNTYVEWYDGVFTSIASGVNSLTDLPSGTYFALITDANNCQKTEEYYVGSITITPTDLTASACDSYLLPWGQTVTTTGTYSNTYTSYQGCDSIVNYEVTITPSTANTSSINSCGNYTWSVNNETYTTSGTYSVVTGCHTETLNLTVTPIPAEPTLACYESTTFNNATCSWDITGTQPTQPTLACYETANFNTTTCAWDVTGSQPSAPTGLACYETTNFNSNTCVWDITGSQPAMPTLACYETATFNTTSCVWDVTGTQPLAPTGLACYETTNFNTTSCAWDITGSQTVIPTLACYETASFNTTSCAWDVTGTQPAAPTGLACYETTNFNTTSCAWDVTGTQPVSPTLACYESTSFNTTTCVWDITGAQPTAPTGLACYETAIFDNDECEWNVSGSQPVQPTLTCYQSTSFNTTTCVWDVTGTQPQQPTLACYETATFDNDDCEWEIDGDQPSAPTGLACYETTNFNTNTCVWDVTGTQPVQPSLACYETASFNSSTCV
jgi:hypothetical protein